MHYKKEPVYIMSYSQIMIIQNNTCRNTKIVQLKIEQGPQLNSALKYLIVLKINCSHNCRPFNHNNSRYEI